MSVRTEEKRLETGQLDSSSVWVELFVVLGLQ